MKYQSNGAWLFDGSLVGRRSHCRAICAPVAAETPGKQPARLKVTIRSFRTEGTLVFQLAEAASRALLGMSPGGLMRARVQVRDGTNGRESARLVVAGRKPGLQPDPIRTQKPRRLPHKNRCTARGISP